MDTEEIRQIQKALKDIDRVIHDMYLRRTYVPFTLECARRTLLRLVPEA